MTDVAKNILLECGKPLIFEVGNDKNLSLVSAENRHGESLRTIVNSMTVFQKEALVTSDRTGKTWRFASDEGKYLQGTDTAPPPLCHLTVGMVASYMNEIVALAKLRDVTIDRIELIQDNYYRMDGSMMKGTMVASAHDVDLEVKIDSPMPKSEILKLIYDAVSASPLNGLMRGEHESLFTLSHNGSEIEPDKALPVQGPTLSDPGVMVDKVEPADGNWNEHCVKQGPTPKLEHSVSGAGSALKDQQNRMLHLRGVCKIRPDGIKEITQFLYNPAGSMFTLLSEEGPENGGQGRAPDATSYISAGIGFCFMTQFGRYAKMQKKDLQSYRIVQDSHYSLGGASGGTGKAGTADPLETHVYLTSSEDDEFARHILDVSEQTCFLHAFCRTDLKTKIRLSGFE